jgi:bifunctional UDP-N-acetylglucosamine pyrophosphorylase / glucosamine-1-phosphate N-acetyltransferase
MGGGQKPHTPIACVVLAAGRGTRMRSARAKVAHALAGRPLLAWVLAAAQALEPAKIIVVGPPDAPEVAQIAAPHPVAVQAARDGTGGALAAALPALEGFCGPVLVLMGDVPLIDPGTLRALLAAAPAGGCAVLGARMDDPTGYGRLILDTRNALARIVEEKDANDTERSVSLVNAGVWALPAGPLPRWLAQIGTDNAAGERYLTDLPPIAARDGARTAVHVTDDPGPLRGVNTRADLAALEAVVQGRLRSRAMAGGATLADPATTYFSWDTALGRDVEVGPCVAFGPGVAVADGARIGAFSHLEGVTVGPGAAVGPFARIRPGTTIGAGARVGNFVEVKASDIGPGAKAGHLAYIGDAAIGAQANFSAGAVVANYDGRAKHRTTVGAGAMVGTNATLVAPVEVGAGAYIAAGSVITRDVEAGALAVARGRQVARAGWAVRRGGDPIPLR